MMRDDVKIIHAYDVNMKKNTIKMWQIEFSVPYITCIFDNFLVWKNFTEISWPKSQWTEIHQNFTEILLTKFLEMRFIKISLNFGLWYFSEILIIKILLKFHWNIMKFRQISIISVKFGEIPIFHQISPVFHQNFDCIFTWVA